MHAPPPSRPDFAVSGGLALGAFAVFVLLPQRTFHGFDTDFYAALLQAGDRQQPVAHVAWLPVCRLLLALVRPCGGGAVQAMWLSSALGSAIGVFCLHRAARLFVDGWRTAWVPIAVALTPACFYFATAAELHGAFAAGSGAAWWAFARWHAQPCGLRAVVLGAAGGAAATLHTFGHVLPVLFVAAGGVLRRAPLQHLAGAGLAVAGTHVAVAMSLSWWLGGGAVGQGGAAAAMLATWWRTMDATEVPGVLWREVVLAYLPWSLLAPAGLAVRCARPWASLWLLAVALHAPVACLLLARSGENFHERGAYLLPTAVPAVFAAAVLLRPAAAWLAVVAAAALAIGTVAPRWAPRYREEFVAAVAQLHAEQPVAFLVGPGEIEGIRTHLDGVVAAEIVRSLEAYYGLNAVPGASVALPQWFDGMLALLGAGRTWVLTDEARRQLEDSPVADLRALWQHVASSYERAPLARPGLVAESLRPRR